jgi:hypothetical protein
LQYLAEFESKRNKYSIRISKPQMTDLTYFMAVFCVMPHDRQP